MTGDPALPSAAWPTATHEPTAGQAIELNPSTLDERVVGVHVPPDSSSTKGWSDPGAYVAVYWPSASQAPIAGQARPCSSVVFCDVVRVEASDGRGASMTVHVPSDNVSMTPVVGPLIGVGPPLLVETVPSASQEPAAGQATEPSWTYWRAAVIGGDGAAVAVHVPSDRVSINPVWPVLSDW
jgi:hypothetical protein